MNSKTEPKARYRVPIRCIGVDVSLDEFDIDDIREYLRHQGCGEVRDSSVNLDESDGCYLDSQDCAIIETLVVCGQKDEAIKFALSIISRAIGREITP